ncbi:MAG: nucleotidyltransferase domain-containing protein [Nitrospirae bacterium]|nr:nucleotidyltransferase domain-containing protein [Nitrospirota bacterium]
MGESRVIDEIVRVLVEHLQPERIILFGSRAKTGEHGYSDFDIAIEGAVMDIREERIIKEILDEKMAIYTVDLITLDKADEEFRKIVLKTGKVLYDRGSKVLT